MDTKKWLILLWLVALLLVTACQDDRAATTVEETEIPTLIPTLIPTEIPTDIPKEDPPTPENTAETSAEGVGKPEDTPIEPLLDSEAMLARLGGYLLRPDDLPHSYSLSEGGELHNTTLRLINDMGELKAKTYVRNTGRIDGWWVQLKRASKADFAPGTFENSIELFESQDGAQTAMTPDYYQLHQDESREYTLVDGGCDLGDRCEFYYSEKEDPATELVTAQYTVAFTYKNAFVWVMARGLTVDLEAGYVLDAARSVLGKLVTAPTK